MAQKQVNIRLPEDDVAVLEAASYLRGESVAELARLKLLELVAGYRSDGRVQEVMRLRAEQTAEEEGVLHPLEKRRLQKQGSDGAE